MSADALDLVVEQIAPTMGRIEENARRLSELAAASPDAGLVVFSELALTGYLVGDRAPSLALDAEDDRLLAAGPDPGPALALGYVERGRDQLVYNAAAVVRGSEILARHRKVYLPTYGIFDEGRTFAPGRTGPPVFELAGWRVGLLICEELWHPALPYLLALQEVDVLLVLSAAPGRHPRTDAAGLRFASSEPWELLARAAAFNHGVWVVVANRVGKEDGLTFAGGSMVVAPDGRIAARAPEVREATLRFTLTRAALREARNPFSHLRDEDPALVVRELRRILGLG